MDGHDDRLELFDLVAGCVFGRHFKPLDLALNSPYSPLPCWQTSGQDDDPSPIHPSGALSNRAYA